jgi:hypothetical protein
MSAVSAFTAALEALLGAVPCTPKPRLYVGSSARRRWGGGSSGRSPHVVG